MSARNRQTGVAPAHRANLTKNLKRMDLRVRMPVYQILRELAIDGESDVAVVERVLLKLGREKRACV